MSSTEGEGTTPNPGLTADEVKGLFNDALKESGILDRLDKIQVDGLTAEIDGLFEKHKSSPVNESGLVTAIDNAVGKRLAGLNLGGGNSGGGNTDGRQRGWLGRWLAGNPG